MVPLNHETDAHNCSLIFCISPTFVINSFFHSEISKVKVFFTKKFV